MADSRAGAGYIQDDCGASGHFRKQGSTKKIKRMGMCQRDLGANPKQLPMAKAEII